MDGRACVPVMVLSGEGNAAHSAVCSGARASWAARLAASGSMDQKDVWRTPTDTI